MPFVVAWVCLSPASTSTNESLPLKAASEKSDSLFLGYYYCGKLYVQDTLSLDKKGCGVFANKEKLNEGTYVMYFHGSKYFDLLIGNDQEFLVEIGDTLSLPEYVFYKQMHRSDKARQSYLQIR